MTRSVFPRAAAVIGLAALLAAISVPSPAQAFSPAPGTDASLAVPVKGGSQMEAGALTFVSGMGDRALSFLRDQSMGQDGKTQEFRKLLESSFDMETIGRFALGKYWRQLSPAQQKEYQSLFRSYVVKVYSARFKEYSGQGFEAKAARADSATPTDTMVSSVIIPAQGEPVSVEWRVRNKNGGYKVVDVIVEGVSMSVTQRSDFDAVIQKGGGNVSALLAQLRQQAG